jgi:hypothetical protein
MNCTLDLLSTATIQEGSNTSDHSGNNRVSLYYIQRGNPLLPCHPDFGMLYGPTRSTNFYVHDALSLNAILNGGRIWHMTST